MKVTLIVLTLLLLTPYTLLSAEEGEYLRYEELIEKVKAGNVESINLGKYSRITGVYIENDNKKQFHSYHESDSANDPLLIELLKEKKVTVNIEEEKERSRWPMMGPGLVMFFVMFIVPIIILIGIVIITRKVNRIIKKLEGK